MSISSAKIDFWINNNLNILFVGRHGVGKTAMIKEAFDRHNLKWKYFSASTMDPWVDFVGVPKEKSDQELPESFLTIRELAKCDINLAVTYVIHNFNFDKTAAEKLVQYAQKPLGTTYLDLVRPHTFASGEIEALFFDEFNRSPKKIRNAVMELIQFGSVNGHKFPNLRFVWAAINPEDDEQLKYDVETCDPAHLDRFHCSVQIPYQPNADWFRSKYGQRIADSAIQWWDELTDDLKKTVSPRRLQYALDIFVKKGDIRDILPVNTNVGKLLTSLKNGPITEQIEELLNSKNEEKARKFLQNENNFASVVKLILTSDTLMNFFLRLMPQEKIMSLMASDDKVCSYIISNLHEIPEFHKISKQVMSANLNPVLVKKIRRALTEDEKLASAFAKDCIELPKKTVMPYFNKKKINWATEIKQIQAMPMDSGLQKIAAYEKIARNIPQQLTVDEAVNTIGLLDQIFSKTNSTNAAEKDKWQFASIILDPSFDKLFGIINHCLYQIHLSKNKASLSTIIHEYSFANTELFKKINQTDMQFKLPSENFIDIR